MSSLPAEIKDIPWKDNNDFDAIQNHTAGKIIGTPMILTDEEEKQKEELIKRRSKLETEVAGLNNEIAECNEQIWEFETYPKIKEHIGKYFKIHRWNVPPASAEDYYEEYIHIKGYDRKSNSYEVKLFGWNKGMRVKLKTILWLPIEEVVLSNEVPKEEWEKEKEEFEKNFE